MTRYRLEYQGSIFTNGNDFCFRHLFRPNLGQTQNPVLRVPRALSSGAKWPKREAETHYYLVTMLRMRGVLPSLHYTSSLRGA